VFRKLDCFRREVPGSGETYSLGTDRRSYSLSLPVNVMQLDVTCVASGAFSDKIWCGSQSAVVGEAYEGKLLVAMTTAACSISVAGADEFATEIRVDISPVSATKTSANLRCDVTWFGTKLHGVNLRS
jgi:hypothetical protein